MHNYFILKNGNCTERVENSVLSSFSGAFLNRNYLDSITVTAVGKKYTAKAEIIAHCFDPSATPFVRYAAQFTDDEMNGYSISEIAMTSADGQQVVNMARASGVTSKQKGTPLEVECTMYLNVAAEGLTLLAGENPLFQWLIGEKREASWSLYPLLRADALRCVTSMPTSGRIGVSVEIVDGEIVCSTDQIVAGYSAVALLLDGVAVLVYETANPSEERQRMEFSPVSDVLVLTDQTTGYRVETISVDEACGNPLAVRRQTYGFVTGSPRAFPTGSFLGDGRVVGEGKKFALISGTTIEVFDGIGFLDVPLTVDCGQPVVAAAIGGDRFLAVALRDGQLRLFDVSGAVPVEMPIERAVSGVTDVAIAADGSRLLAAMSGMVFEMLLSETGSVLHLYSHVGEGIVALNNSTMTAIRLSDGVLTEYGYQSVEREIRSVSYPYGAAVSVRAFGGLVDVINAAGQHHLVEMGTGKVTSFEGEEGTLTFSPDGTYVAVKSPQGKVSLYFYHGEDGELYDINVAFPVVANVFPVKGGALYCSGKEVMAIPILEEYEYLLFPPDRGQTVYRIYCIDRSLSRYLTIGFRAVV